jgi:hypothetical protein
MVMHENKHIDDWLERYGPDVCTNVPDGYLPVGGDNYESFVDMSECDAYLISDRCLENLKNNSDRCLNEEDKEAVERDLAYGKQKIYQHCP